MRDEVTPGRPAGRSGTGAGVAVAIVVVLGAGLAIAASGLPPVPTLLVALTVLALAIWRLRPDLPAPVGDQVDGAVGVLPWALMAATFIGWDGSDAGPDLLIDLAGAVIGAWCASMCLMRLLRSGIGRLRPDDTEAIVLSDDRTAAIALIVCPLVGLGLAQLGIGFLAGYMLVAVQAVGDASRVRTRPSFVAAVGLALALAAGALVWTFVDEPADPFDRPLPSIAIPGPIPTPWRPAPTVRPFPTFEPFPSS